jgi:hypothetical protein
LEDYEIAAQRYLDGIPREHERREFTRTIKKHLKAVKYFLENHDWDERCFYNPQA